MGALLGVSIFLGLFFIIAGAVFGLDYIIGYYEKVFGE